MRLFNLCEFDLGSVDCTWKERPAYLSLRIVHDVVEAWASGVGPATCRARAVSVIPSCPDPSQTDGARRGLGEGEGQSGVDRQEVIPSLQQGADVLLQTQVFLAQLVQAR